MITDSQTNQVYIAQGLCKYRTLSESLLKTLCDCGIPVRFLPATESQKHVWARDYMPIQIDKDTFLLYQYNPDYLKDDQDYIPDYRTICHELHLNLIETDIILDGGNVIKCGDKVIMTDKIFHENPTYSHEALVKELERLFHAKLVLIPWDHAEIYGHADGMVRYIGNNRVLITCYQDFDITLRQRLIDALSPHFKVEELSFGSRKFPHKWAYINYLHIGNNIFLPSFDVPEDEAILQQFIRLFPDCKLHQIAGCKSLVKDGGLLNCTTWNIYQESDNNMLEGNPTLFSMLQSFNGAEGFDLHTHLECLTAKFHDLARQIIFGGYIQVNHRRIYISDVEFYFHEECGSIRDPQMYHTSLKTGDDQLPYIDLGNFFTHLGLDLTFENANKKYRASVLLRSYYIVEDGKCPYLDATKKPDTRYSYLYSALLADMNIFSGINIRWIDEPTDVPLPLNTSIRKNINPVASDPEGYQRLWRFKI